MSHMQLAAVELNLLVVLHELLRTRTTRLSARRLRRTQSAVSHALQRLERGSTNRVRAVRRRPYGHRARRSDEIVARGIDRSADGSVLLRYLRIGRAKLRDQHDRLRGCLRSSLVARARRQFPNAALDGASPTNVRRLVSHRPLAAGNERGYPRLALAVPRQRHLLSFWLRPAVRRAAAQPSAPDPAQRQTRDRRMTLL